MVKGDALQIIQDLLTEDFIKCYSENIQHNKPVKFIKNGAGVLKTVSKTISMAGWISESWPRDHSIKVKVIKIWIRVMLEGIEVKQLLCYAAEKSTVRLGDRLIWLKVKALEINSDLTFEAISFIG